VEQALGRPDERGDQSIMQTGTNKPAPASGDWKRKLPAAWRLFCLAVVLLVAVVALYGALRFLPNHAVRYDDIEDHFKYGSTGGEVNFGFPYWIWQEMPLLCPEYLPRERLRAGYMAEVKGRPRGQTAADRLALSREGYKAMGLLYETDDSGAELALPVGVSNRRHLGLQRVFVNCAVCHTSTVRESPGDEPQLVLGMPANRFDLNAFEHFFFDCANDERFNKHNIIPDIDALGAHLGLVDKLLVYPVAIWVMRDQVKLLQSRLGFSGKQPPWGPGRVDTFSAAKAIFDWPWQGLPDWHDSGEVDPRSLGTADFPSIWLQGPRKVRADGRQMQLHWDGNNDKVEERNLSAAYGTGALPPIIDHAAVGRIEEWLLGLEPPTYPYAIDEALAARGRAVYQEYCAACHGVSGRDFTGQKVGYVTPIDEVGTDRYRLDNYEYTLAVNQATLYAGTPYRFTHFRKTYGYANMPLDGIWLRAPYLHNGSVPDLRSLLAPAADRPTVFYRGYDVYDPQNVGFVHTVPEENGLRFFRFDTAVPGNSNRGHEGPAYGTQLPEAEKAALLEYLKTF
jgi:mono/diheme cytochrome c family protein